MRWARVLLGALTITLLTSVPVDAQQATPDYEAIRRLIHIDQEAQKGNTDAAEDLVRLTFPEDPETAVRIARRESGFRCNADNPYSSAAGIMQTLALHKPHAQRMGMTWAQVQTSCLANLTVARALYEESGWDPWRL